MPSSENNKIATKPKFSVAINTPTYQKLINQTLGDPVRAKHFVATITSAVAVNPALQECESSSILACALLGESLNLSPSPQLGQFYLVPFKQKEKRNRDGEITQIACTKAQFILGYRGYIQLAIRTGQYRKINVIEIREGELTAFDPLNETIECAIIHDIELRRQAPVAGYFAMFELLNGFRKAIYWTKGEMVAHADQYAQAFSAQAYEKLQNGKIADADLWKYSSFWYKDFDAMAKKTMIRQLISHWGFMSAEMQYAFERDVTVNEIGPGGEIFTGDDVQGEETLSTPVEAAEVIEPEQVSLDDV